MASFTVSTAPWPAGQVVNAYPAEAWPDTRSAPSGAAAATGTVSSVGTVTFDGLADNRRYVAYAAGKGVRFATSMESLSAPVALSDRQRIKALEDAIGVGSTSRVLLWSDAEAGYLPAALCADTSAPREFVGPVDPSTISSVAGPVFGDRWTPTEEPVA